jgi:hypothetical protein
MFNIPHNLLKQFIRISVLVILCVALGNLAVPILNSPAQAAYPEPISYIGHGAMFNQQGEEIAPTLQFIRQAQDWYKRDLLRKLNKNQRAEFDRLERNLSEGLTLDEQSRLVLNTNLVNWLMDAAKVDSGDRIRGKQNFIKFLLKTKLNDNSDNKLPRGTELFKPHPELLKRMKANERQSLSGISPSALTNAGGAAYRAECLANGVPIPPDMGNPAWVSRGQIPRLPNPPSVPLKDALYIASDLEAEVLTYTSTSPLGMCVALPRFNSENTVQLDGVICLGQATSKACFWDNQENGGTFTFQRGSSVPFSRFGGGTDLKAGIGGTCTDCHAGENPYIIHGNVLDSLASLGLPTFTGNWHDPIVGTATPPWPENPGPMNAPTSCVGCHVQGVSGRFPHLSTALPEYCNTVLKLSIQRAMPPGAPGSLVGTPEMIALQNWCGIAASGDAAGRGDPHITTFNRVDYDFQSAGEFVYLRDASGLEIQTRQTPVSTASALGPNRHTGLSSCVSVNTAVAARVGKHRVSYQPNFNQEAEKRPLELRIDGKLVELGASGIDLGDGGRVVKSRVGEGIEIFFPDQTNLIAIPTWWESQKTWYLNVDVVNTPGREGIMGAIAPDSWLPLLPDGTTMGAKPAALQQRYTDLYKKFANAWRVAQETSLFDYQPGTSTATFTNKKWPPYKGSCTLPNTDTPPAEPIDLEKAQQLCKKVVDKSMKEQCILDVSATGEPDFAKAYRTTQVFYRMRLSGQ